MVSFPLGIRGRRLLAAALLGVLVVAVAWRHASSAPAPAPLRVAPVVPSASPPPRAGQGATAARRLVVDVAGAVRRPGLVHLREGDRVADAIARAGGFGRGAERTAVNLAAPVADGQQVLVPRRGGGGVAAGSGGAAPAMSGPVSLSSATVEQLDELPGVGPVTAQKIVAYRQEHGAFRSIDELDAVPGIGPARLADLRELVAP
jgi:competence protein ComEA